MAQLDLNGRRFEVDDTGGDGPPVLCTTGPSPEVDATGAFASQTTELGDIYRMLSWDARGADPVGAGPTASMWELAEDAFALLDLLGIERAVMVGVGRGAALGLCAALLHPDRVRALALIDVPEPDPTARSGPEEPWDRLDELAMPVLVGHRAGDQALARARMIHDVVDDCRGLFEIPTDHATSDVPVPTVLNPALRTFLEGLPA